MGSVKIFCDCGREIWQDLSPEIRNSRSLSQIAERAICSDCILRETTKPDGPDLRRSRGRVACKPSLKSYRKGDGTFGFRSHFRLTVMVKGKPVDLSIVSWGAQAQQVAKELKYGDEIQVNTTPILESRRGQSDWLYYRLNKWSKVREDGGNNKTQEAS